MKLPERFWYYLLVSILFAVPCLDFKNWFLGTLLGINIGIVQTPSGLVQVWLLIAGGWVAVETYKIRLVSVRQTEIQIAPVLVVYFREKQRRVTVKNVGKGPAFDVQLEKITTIVEGTKMDRREGNYDLKIADPPVLIPGEEREIVGKLGIQGVVIFDSVDSTAWINPKYAVADFEFAVIYSDMKDNKYVSRIRAGKSGTRLFSYRRL